MHWYVHLLLRHEPPVCHSLAQIDVVLKKENVLGVPVAFNPKKIEKHCKLVMLDDMSLLKINKTEKEKSAKTEPAKKESAKK